jgi:pyruvate dehydrogenase E2 component (dihydrolipoamide acetyltransferase)
MSYPITIDSAGGEYMETVVIVEWAVALGEAVRAGDVVVTVETAKAATEIEASHDGYLTEILYPVGSEAPVGAVLGRIGESMEAVSAPAEATTENAVDSDEDAAGPKAAPKAGARVVASPLARRLAKAAGIDLAAVRGSGPRGRIKQRDIEAVIVAGGTPIKQAVPRAAAIAGAQATSAPTVAADLPPLVLLHGFGADRFAWRWVAPLLDCANRVVTLELPGHGNQAADPARSIDDMAFALSDQLEALGIARAHLVGHSLGGAVALKLAQLGRVETLSLGLIAPAGLGPEINGAFLRGFLDATGPDNLMPWLKLMVSNPAALPNGFGAAVMRQRNSVGIAAQAEIAGRLFANGTQSFDLRDALQSVRVPTRVIWGRQDAIIPAHHAAAVPGTAGLHLLNGIGHTAPMECPDLLARIIVELVRSVG